MDITQELTHISLCAGYGGIDLGLTRALRSVRTVCFVEIEAFVIENLVSKIEAELLDPAPIFSDLKKFPWELYHGKVDILSGGFPCQPFSGAGKRKGSDDPRHLWPFITDGIKRLGRPPIVFFENVEGIISSKLKGDDWSDPEGTPVLLHVLRELERLGYKAKAGLFSAVEVGAPHQRKRVFILAIRADLKPSGYGLISSELRADEPSTIYPASRGSEQYEWEPPRVVKMGHTTGEGLERLKQEKGQASDVFPIAANADRGSEATQSAASSSTSEHIQGPLKSSLGGYFNGYSCWLDHAELYESCDNRTDELRMLGNGVVPDTAARAFRVLFEKLAYTKHKTNTE